MDDENKLLEVDTRVRVAVSPPAYVVDRVVMRALSASDRRPQHGSRLTFAVVTLATVVLLIALTVWQGRQRAGEHTLPTSLAITGEGSMLVVESQDGRRWIVGPAPKRRIGGGYVIVVPQ
jgi:hypothetical protein